MIMPATNQSTTKAIAGQKATVTENYYYEREWQRIERLNKELAELNSCVRMRHCVIYILKFKATNNTSTQQHTIESNNKNQRHSLTL